VSKHEPPTLEKWLLILSVALFAAALIGILLTDVT
jgi:hypothetical protein